MRARFGATGNGCPLDSLLKSTYGILFFGTPHRGMLVKNLQDALKQGGYTSRNELLEDIQNNSKTLSRELDRFIDLCDGLKIYSFYERGQTREVVVVRPSWETVRVRSDRERSNTVF